MIGIPVKSKSKYYLKRLRIIEEMYLGGHSPKEIHSAIGDKYDVSLGTIRNNIVTIRKSWTADKDSMDTQEGSQRYIASLRQLRRKALQPWEMGKKQGRDLRLVHQLDQEIARMSGVKLKADEKTIHLEVESAKKYIDEIMRVVFQHVLVPATRQAIIDDLEKINEPTT